MNVAEEGNSQLLQQDEWCEPLRLKHHRDSWTQGGFSSCAVLYFFLSPTLHSLVLVVITLLGMLRYNVFHHGDFKKVLVANRGEIACRVFRTCREMNIRTVAVCCEGEPNAKHVLEADEAFVLGPPPASTSYLRGDRIICAAKKLQADAVHPGYGFLSENAEFASAVLAAGLKFVGPPPAAMLSMGSKSESKRIMEAAGVPIVPGYYGEDQNPDRLLHGAKTIGFPVLIKAVSGGGGKGMKIVMEETEFHLMLESAKREAINFFKDDRVILE